MLQRFFSPGSATLKVCGTSPPRHSERLEMGPVAKTTDKTETQMKKTLVVIAAAAAMISMTTANSGSISGEKLDSGLGSMVYGESLDSGLGSMVYGESLDSGLGELTAEDLQQYFPSRSVQTADAAR